MPLTIKRADITSEAVDIIVNAANPALRNGGGVNGAIHRKAGPQLREECRKLGGCQPGQAKITSGFNLQCKYIIHTVGPKWNGGGTEEFELLASCYQSSLALAKALGCSSIAFPIISSGAYGFPKEKALQIAIREISHFLLENEMDIRLVVYNKSDFVVSEDLLNRITKYIKECIIEPQYYDSNTTVLTTSRICEDEKENNQPEDTCYVSSGYSLLDWQRHMNPGYTSGSVGNAKSLKEALQCIDESFSEMLLRRINQSGMTDAQCYRKANIDRRLFSKIRSDRFYRPKKGTVLAFAVALELSISETKELLMKAGFAFSHSSKYDIIVEYLITHRYYDIYEINSILFTLDQPTLGG